jgi:hypothetical protein
LDVNVLGGACRNLLTAGVHHECHGVLLSVAVPYWGRHVAEGGDGLFLLGAEEICVGGGEGLLGGDY